MPLEVTHGAMLQCSFGVTPAALVVTPANRVIAGSMPAATIMDHVPLENIPSFGMCMSPANPAVAAATTAAMGVLTPMPCIPATVTPWVPGGPTVLIGKMPCLDNSCTLACLWAGIIQVTAPAQVTVNVP